MKSFVFAIFALFTASFTLFAVEISDTLKTADGNPWWTLAEAPAIIAKTHPEDALSKPCTYMAISSIVVTTSGSRVIAAWYAGDSEGGENINNCVLVSYGDNNLSFDRIHMVIRSPHEGKVRCSDPFLWREPSGRVWLAWTQSTGEYEYSGLVRPKADGHWSRRGATWAVHTDNPDASEPVWSQPRRLFDGMMVNKPCFLKNGGILFGAVQFPTWNIQDLHSREDGARIWLTTDNCETFTQIGLVRPPESQYVEPTIVEKTDGAIWILTRRDSHSAGRLLAWDRNAGKWISKTFIGDGHTEAVSTDGGRTFGPSTISPIPGVGSRTIVSRLASGSLLLIKNYCDDDELWLQGKPKIDRDERAPYRRDRMAAYLSQDDGATWQGGLILDDDRTDAKSGRRNVAYPDASQGPDGFIYVCWDYSRTNEPEIRAAKITENDVLARKIITSGSISRAVISRGPKFNP